MKSINASPGNQGKTTLITVEASPEDAKRFLEAFRTGELAHLGIKAVRSPLSPLESDNWTDLENKRAKDDRESDRGRS